MAFPLAAFFLSYLLTVSFSGQISENASAMQQITDYFYTDQIRVNASAVQKLVDYGYTTETGELLPGVLYNNSINVSWAVGDSALRGLDGKIIIVRATASASNDSEISFVSMPGFQQKTAVAYLQCVVANGTCSNSSNLSVKIPFTISVKEKQTIEEVISLKSEIAAAGAVPSIDTGEIQKTAGELFDSFKNVFSQNETKPADKPEPQKNASPHANASNTTGNGNFLDSLKPEGDSKNPLEFLRANPIISIAALGIVIIITGAYLINAKD